MDEKKVTKISLSTFFLILAIIVIIVMGYFIYELCMEKTNENETISNLNSKVGSLENTISDLESKINDTSDVADASNSSVENKKVTISVDSDYGKAISTYLPDVWVNDSIYEDNIAEFQDVKNAPKKYLATCTAYKLMQESNDVYNKKVKFSDFNNTLVKLFGEEADGLLKQSDIENVFFVAKNSGGTYTFNGFDFSEVNESFYIIKDIEKEGNIFHTYLYEYKTETDKVVVELEEGQEAHNYIYDKKNNLILKTTIKATQNGNTTSYREYDEDGNKIDSFEKLLLSKYEDKLSVRQVDLKYVEDDNSFVLVSDELVK